MPLITRSDFSKSLKTDSALQGYQIYLFTGDTFLARESASLLIKSIKDIDPNTVISIDGNNEDPAITLARLQSYTLLAKKQIYLVQNSQLFHSKIIAKELWTKAEAAYIEGKSSVAAKKLRSLAVAASLKLATPTPFSEIHAKEWHQLFQFEKPAESLQWADDLLFQTRDKINTPKTTITESYLKIFQKGFPDTNILILLADTVDKRHKIYKWINKNALIIDCSVASGSSNAAQTEQKKVLQEIMSATLQKFNKKIDPRCTGLFFEKIGFHPVAIVNETEKLAHYVDEREIITAQDLEEMVIRNREDALYELTDACGKRNVALAICIVNRLLNQGIHSLAILTTLRNYTRKHLLYRSIQISSSPPWRNGMQFKEFQSRYLLALNKNKDWAPSLTGHPYALFINFSKASEFSCNELKDRLQRILNAEYRLKGSPLSSKIILEELLLSMIKGSPAKTKL